MKMIVQRVKEAAVSVEGETPRQIDKGLLLFVGIEEGDNQEKVEQMVQKVLSFRVFPDQQGKMNRSIQEAEGDLLVIPNFTLCADTDSGNRPSFGPAAAPDRAESLFDKLYQNIRRKAPGNCHSGLFGANMDVSLTNDGPVTFILTSD